MPAIISEQFRILNAETFVKSFVGVGSTVNKYYAFMGLPNSIEPAAGGTAMGTNTPAPLDGFEEEYSIKESIIAMKKVTDKDVRRLVRKVKWVAGTTYEMYRHDYNIYNLTPITSQGSLYEANYYIVNEDLKVYVCLQNGSDPENPKGILHMTNPHLLTLNQGQLALVAMVMFGNTFTRLSHPKSLNLTLLNTYQCPKTGGRGRDCCNTGVML